MRRTSLGALAALVILLMAAPLPGIGAGGAASAGATPESADDEATNFFLGNLLFFFYHEMGHALIGEFGLPVVGKEEDAVDQLATLILIEVDADAAAGGEATEQSALTLAAAVGWLTQWERLAELGVDDMPYWDEHSLDIQRFYNIVCLVYGSDPESFAAAAAKSGMPEERALACIDEYARVAQSWSRLLEPHLQDAGLGAGGRVSVDYRPVSGPDAEEMRTALMGEHLLEELAADLDQSFAFPANIQIVLAECGEENAYWDPEAKELTLCHELLATFAVMVPAD